MEAFIKSAWLPFLLLNPFLMSVYLIALIRDLDRLAFALVMRRAHLEETRLHRFVSVWHRMRRAHLEETHDCRRPLPDAPGR